MRQAGWSGDDKGFECSVCQYGQLDPVYKTTIKPSMWICAIIVSSICITFVLKIGHAFYMVD